jgi:chaperone modulatory protein CbpM
MNIENFIPLNQLSTHYQVEVSFFNNLNEMGLIEIQTIEQVEYIQEDKIQDIEKMVRMHHELDVNIEGIDVVFNLLQKIHDLQEELMNAKRQLRRYE